jgi:hypothetical protein
MCEELTPAFRRALRGRALRAVQATCADSCRTPLARARESVRLVCRNAGVVLLARVGWSAGAWQDDYVADQPIQTWQFSGPLTTKRHAMPAARPVTDDLRSKSEWGGLGREATRGRRGGPPVSRPCARCRKLSWPCSCDTAPGSTTPCAGGAAGTACTGPGHKAQQPQEGRQAQHARDAQLAQVR